MNIKAIIAQLQGTSRMSLRELRAVGLPIVFIGGPIPFGYGVFH